MSWVIGTLLGSGLVTLPANAIPPNQSDITGTNIWNNTAPIFDNNGKLPQGILDNARRLSQQLSDTSAQCYNATAPIGPRRFAIGPGNSNQVCISPGCQRLNSLVEETRTFLIDVNRSQVQQQTASRNRIW